MRGHDGDALEVVVFRTIDAPRRRRPRRPKRAEAGAPEPLPEPTGVARVTVVAAEGFDDEPEAKDWLESACRNEREREDEVEAALRSVNRAIQAHRLSAADPYVREVTSAQAHEVRLGFGRGDELVEGRWQDAAVLPPAGRRQRRRPMLAPQEQLAGILSGRRPAYASEDLVLRARLDLDQGRTLQSALQLRPALEALEAELRAQGGDTDSAQLDLVHEHSGLLSDIVARGLRGDLDEAQRASLTAALEHAEQLLRRRRHIQDR